MNLWRNDKTKKCKLEPVNCGKVARKYIGEINVR